MTGEVAVAAQWWLTLTGEVAVRVAFAVPVQWWLRPLPPSDRERAVRVARMAAADAAERTLRARWEDLEP
jgi:hypothetical protein